MKKNNKTEYKKLIECYIYIFLITIMFFGFMIAVGIFTQAGWIFYIKELILNAIKGDELYGKDYFGENIWN